jgi:tRNA nucleotidyltransferase/poly(A) polymerase
LGFAIEEATYRAMKALHAEIRKASPARLHEEICKLFGYGVSEAAFRLLRETGLFQEMFPGPAARLSAAPPDGSLFWKCLGAFDVCEPKPGACPPSLVWAVLAYPWFEECITSDEGTHRREVHERCAHEAARLASGNIPLSRRAFAETFHLLISVARMRTSLGDWGSHGRRAARMRFAHHESFPMALKLWEVANRASGESIEDIHRWQAEAARAASTAPRHTERHSAAPGDRNRHPDFRGRPRRRRGRRHNFDRFRDTRDGSNPSAPQASLPE